MKIITDNKTPSLASLLRKYITKRKWLLVGVLVLFLVLFFFASYNYGGYLQQTSQTRYFKQLMLDMSRLDFSFVENYIEGQKTELEEFQIDIKFKHLIRLNYLRDQASKKEFIDDVFKEEEFPATITHNGKVHKVKISLTGVMSKAHLGDPNKWSFQVKVKGDNTIMGIKRFGLLIPTARGNLTDWIGFALLRYRGLIGLRVDYVDVTINGKYLGVYYFEERYDKNLIEYNKLREGIIFKLDQELQPYQESKLMLNPETRAQVLLLKHMWLEVVAGNMAPQQFFDMEKMAKVFAFSDLMNNQHQLSKENIRYYFNPVTGLVEPIVREFENLNRSNPEDLKIFLDKPVPYTVHYWHRREPIIQLITNNYDFQRYYIREAQLISQKEFLDEFFENISDDLDSMQRKMYRSWPFYKFPSDILYANQKKMREVLFSEDDGLHATLLEKKNDLLNIELQNIQNLPYEVTHLSLNDSIFFYPDDEVVVPSEVNNVIEKKEYYCFRIPNGVFLSQDNLSKLKVHYNLLGSTAEKKPIQVLLHPKLEL